MQHIRNLLVFIAGTVLATVIVGLFFLLLSFLLPGLMADMGYQYQKPPDPELGRQYFCTIGLATGAILGLMFMTISIVISGIKHNRSQKGESNKAIESDK